MGVLKCIQPSFGKKSSRGNLVGIIADTRATSRISRFSARGWLSPWRCLCAGTTGCVRRRLTVRTQPPGAQVFVDDQEIGTTPCSSSFVYYGTRKVTLIKDGYRTETIYQKLNPPWYQIPPLDFASDNLLIRELRDERIVDVQMVPQEIVPQARLLERANALRNGA